MNECPCDLCVVRAMCLSREYNYVLSCKIVKCYLGVDKTGDVDIPKLRVVCRSMNLKLHENEPIWCYYIDPREKI